MQKPPNKKKPVNLEEETTYLCESDRELNTKDLKNIEVVIGEIPFLLGKMKGKNSWQYRIDSHVLLQEESSTLKAYGVRVIADAKKAAFISHTDAKSILMADLKGSKSWLEDIAMVVGGIGYFSTEDYLAAACAALFAGAAASQVYRKFKTYSEYRHDPIGYFKRNHGSIPLGRYEKT